MKSVVLYVSSYLKALHLVTNRHIAAVMSQVKVKWSRYRPGVAQRVGRGIALLFYDCGTRKGWMASSTPRPHFTPGKDPVPIVQRLGGPQGRSGRAENFIPTGIPSRTVQHVVSRCNDWATRPTSCLSHHTNYDGLRTSLTSRYKL